MTQFVKVGSRTEFEDLEGGKFVEAGGHRIAVRALIVVALSRREWWWVKKSSALGTVPDSM
jgi:hypothetical protein